jgi:PKD repeat protein
MKKNYSLVILFAIFFAGIAHANTYYVSNNFDTGAGSLSQAISNANGNQGKDTVLFNIPSSSLTGRTITISSSNPLPTITDPIFLDGTSQVAGNEFGITTAKIQITCTDFLTTGLVLNADSCEVYGLYINHFVTGLRVLGGDFKIGAINDGNVINNCSEVCVKISDVVSGSILATFVGLDTNGVVGVSPTAIGISIESSKKVTIGGKQSGARNLISGNNIGIKISDSKFIDIQSNYIGMDASGYFPAPNVTGMFIAMSSNNINIGGDSLKEQNLISGNLQRGIDAEMYSSTIQGNLIGVDWTATYPAGNGEYGIYMRDLSHDNVIGGITPGAGNVIAHNGLEGIFFQNSGVKNISIRGNSMYCNSETSGSGGIVTNGGNQDLAPPSLAIVTENFITGTSIPGLEVDLYTADSCQTCEGSKYLVTIIPDETGVFSISLVVTGKITATSNDTLGNTSEFAQCQDSSSSSCIFASFILSDDKVCSNSPIDFTDQSISVPGSTITTWAWDFGDGQSSTTSDPTHSYADVGSYTVQLIVKNSEGCIDTVEQEVVVEDGVLSDFTAPTQVCVGEPAHLVDQSVPQGSTFIVSWNWDLGDGEISNATDFEHTYDSSGIFTIILEVLNNNGCSSIDSQTISVLDRPTAQFSFAALACSTDPVEFTDLSTTPSGTSITSWSWNFGDGGGSSDQNPDHLFILTGNYTITLVVTNNLGCNDTIQKEVEILSGPVASFTYIISGQAVIFQNNSAVSSDYSVLWDFGDGSTSMLANPVHNYSDDGQYEVCLIIQDFVCDLSDTICQVILITGMEDVEALASIIISPNPVTDQITLSNLPKASVMHTIRLMNTIGEEVMKWTPETNGQSTSLTLSIPPLATGLYLLEIQTGDGMAVKQLIVSNR